MIAHGALEDLTLGIHEEDGGKPADFVFLCEFVILLLQFGVEFLFARIVEFNEDEVFFGGFDELRFGEHLFVKLLARRAPVGSGEVDKDRFPFLFGLGFGGFEIRGPSFYGSSGEGYRGEEDGGDGGEWSHHAIRRNGGGFYSN